MKITLNRLHMTGTIGLILIFTKSKFRVTPDFRVTSTIRQIKVQGNSKVQGNTSSTNSFHQFNIQGSCESSKWKMKLSSVSTVLTERLSY